MATETEWHGRQYSAENQGVLGIQVKAPSGAFVAANELEAVRWLTSRSLRKGKARALVRDELDKNAIVVA